MKPLVKKMVVTAASVMELTFLAGIVPPVAFLGLSEFRLDHSNYSFKVSRQDTEGTRVIYAFDDKHAGQINRLVEVGTFREPRFSLYLPRVVTITSNDKDFQAKLVQAQSLRRQI